MPLPLPLPLTLPLPLPLLLPPPLTSPPFPTRLRHPTPLPDRPTTRPTVHPSTPLLSLPPTSPALFHLPTNPTSNASHQRSVICGLSNSLRGLLLPETLPLSLPPFLCVSLRPKTTFYSPLSFSLLPQVYYLALFIYLSLYSKLQGRSSIHEFVEFFIRGRQHECSWKRFYHPCARCSSY